MRIYAGDLPPKTHGHSSKLLRILILLGGGVVGGIILGLMYALSAQLTYIILVSPLCVAILIAMLATQIVRYAKIRHRLTIGLFGGLMAVIFYITFWYGTYWLFKREARMELQMQQAAISPLEADALVDQFLQDAVAQRGFVGYVRWNIHQGMRMKSTTYQEGSQHFGSTEVIGYRLIEFVLIFGASVFFGISQTKDPFCEDTQSWLTYKTIGFVAEDQVNAFLQAITANDFHQASALIQPTAAKPHLEVKIARFHALSADGRLHIVAHSKRVQDVIKHGISRQAYEMLSV